MKKLLRFTALALSFSIFLPSWVQASHPCEHCQVYTLVETDELENEGNDTSQVDSSEELLNNPEQKDNLNEAHDEEEVVLDELDGENKKEDDIKEKRDENDKQDKGINSEKIQDLEKNPDSFSPFPIWISIPSIWTIV